MTVHFSLANNGSSESHQCRQPTRSYAKQFNGMIKGIATSNYCVDEKKGLKKRGGGRTKEADQR